jgi:YHS domain-containing protein
MPSHLSSPSPYLRRSLLSILIDVFPVLAAHEDSFLPLINDLWPAVAARITFPSSLNTPSASTALLGGDTTGTQPDRSKQGIDEFDFQEETFVTAAACKAIETMFKTAGDFMASRVETEFSRWERLYNRAWEKVRQDTDRVFEKRQQQLLSTSNRPSSETLAPAIPTPTQIFIQSLSLTKTGSTSGSRAFTPHHILWRSLVSLFLSLLSHVRLPLPVGDRICHMLGEWIARYAGPTYYFSRPSQHTERESSDKTSQTEEIASLETVIHAMETWNADLTWFIFRRQRGAALASLAKKGTSVVGGEQDCNKEALRSASFAGGRIGFA